MFVWPWKLKAATVLWCFLKGADCWLSDRVYLLWAPQRWRGGESHVTVWRGLKCLRFIKKKKEARCSDQYSQAMTCQFAHHRKRFWVVNGSAERWRQVDCSLADTVYQHTPLKSVYLTALPTVFLHFACYLTNALWKLILFLYPYCVVAFVIIQCL